MNDPLAQRWPGARVGGDARIRDYRHGDSVENTPFLDVAVLTPVRVLRKWRGKCAVPRVKRNALYTSLWRSSDMLVLPLGESQEGAPILCGCGCYQ